MPIFVWALTVAYALIFTLLGVWRYTIHRNLTDFGIFAQTVASAFGCFCNTVEGSHWAYHFSPILYLAGAIVKVAHTPYTLIAMQACACALTIPPIYGIVARRASVSIAAFAAIVVFLYPPLAGLAFGDFHENVFAPAAVAWMFWAFDGEYLPETALLALVVLAINEQQSVFLAIAGALGAWRYRGAPRGQVASVVLIASVLVFAGFFAVIQPGFPAHSARASLLSPDSGGWTGYVLVAFAFVVRMAEPSRAVATLGASAVLCVLALIVAGRLHPGLNLRSPQPRDRQLDAVLASVPRDIPLATQEEAYTHLALHDPLAALLPESANEEVCTPLVLLDDAFPHAYEAELTRLVDRHVYVLTERHGDIAIYGRTKPCPRIMRVP